MKYVFMILLSFYSLFTYTQDTTFNFLNYSYPATNSFYAIDKLGTNYYLLMSQIDTPNYYNYQNYGVLKLDSSLNIIDSNMIDLNRTVVAINGSGFKVSPVDTSILFIGTIKEGNYQYNGYLVKFNKELDTLWTKEIQHPDTAYADTAQTPWVVLRDIKITPEGNYLMVGNYNYHCQGDADNSFIIKMDTSGNILWYKLLDPSIYQTYITNIEIDPIDSGFYFISFDGISNLFSLFKHNKLGAKIWNSSLNVASFVPYTTKIKYINNQIIVGLTYVNWITSSYQERYLNMIAFNPNTHLINWSKVYTSISVESQYLRQEVIDIEKMPNGYIAVGSVGMKYKDSAFSYDIRANILKLNSNGDSLWSHYYCYQNDSAGVETMQFNDMVVCDDGGILFGGSYYSYPLDPQFIRAWLVKTDSLGNAPGMFTIGIEEEELVLKQKALIMYPNPTSSDIHLRFNENPNEQYLLRIFNSSGQLVKKEKLSAFIAEQKINISSLKSGIYFVQLSSKNKIIYKGKVVKQ